MTEYNRLIRAYKENKGHQYKRNRGGSISEVDEEMETLLIQVVQDKLKEKPTITLKEMQSILSNSYPFKPSNTTQTISRILDGERFP